MSESRMTTEQIDVLEAGLDMDEAVAEVCGVAGFPHSSGVWLTGGADGKGDVPFRPSSDWNDAMYAAERFGLWTSILFGAVGPCSSGVPPKEYGCFQFDMTHGCNVRFSTASTGPLAICRAILKLHAGSSGYIESLEKEIRDEIKRRDAEHWDYVRGSGTDSPATRREATE